MEKVDVSIIMITYNHEKYIKEAINSIFMQNTTYSYELLIGNDCSTDNTHEIIAELIKDKDHIKYYKRENNLGMLRNALDLLSKANGKYLAFLEGDDFWISPEKLQKQINFLESHPDYSSVYHDCFITDQSSKLSNTTFWCKKDDYYIHDYNNFVLPGQTGTLMLRNYVHEFDFSILKEVKNLPGDRILPLVLLSKGKVGFISAPLSAYRHITSNSESWSTSHELTAFEKYTRVCLGTLEAEKIGHALQLQVNFLFVRAFSAAQALVTGIRYKNKEYRQAFVDIYKITNHKLLFILSQLFFIPRTIIGHKKWIQKPH